MVRDRRAATAFLAHAAVRVGRRLQPRWEHAGRRGRQVGQRHAGDLGYRRRRRAPIARAGRRRLLPAVRRVQPRRADPGHRLGEETSSRRRGPHRADPRRPVGRQRPAGAAGAQHDPGVGRRGRYRVRPRRQDAGAQLVEPGGPV